MRLKLFVFFIAMISLASCGELTQELRINRNGKTYQSILSEEADKNMASSLFEYIDLSTDSLDDNLDTTIMLRDHAKNGIDTRNFSNEELELLEDVGINLSKRIGPNGKNMTSMKLFIEYDSEEERDKIYNVLDKWSDVEGRKMEDPTSPSIKEVQNVIFNYTNDSQLGKFEVSDGKVPSDIFGGMDISAMIAVLGQAEIEELKKSFVGSMTKRITLPGKITNVSTKNYTLENDSTIILPLTFWDILSKGKVSGFTIEYDSGIPITDPKLTEVWDPEPTIVTPGKEKNKAPSDAIILFAGRSAEAWMHDDGAPIKWKDGKKEMTVNPGAGQIKTKELFGDCQLHIEWRSPKETATGQGKGNSGIFFQGLYELQVLNSYENRTYSNGQAGSKQKVLQ